MLTASGNCQYTTPSGERVVSQAGIGMFRSDEDRGFVAAMAIPVQTHPASVTAGDWSFIGLDKGALIDGHLSVNNSGRAIAVRGCDASGNCTDEAPGSNEVFVAKSDGGFVYDGGRAGPTAPAAARPWSCFCPPTASSLSARAAGNRQHRPVLEPDGHAAVHGTVCHQRQ